MKFKRIKYHEYQWNDLHSLEHEIEIGVETLRKILANQAHFINKLKVDFETNVANDKIYSYPAY